MAHTKREAVSGTLVNLSMLLYMTWLLLPAVQTTLRAVTGVLAVGLFGVGAMLAGGTLGGRIRWLAPRALLCVLLPVALFFLLERGGGRQKRQGEQEQQVEGDRRGPVDLAIHPVAQHRAIEPRQQVGCGIEREADLPIQQQRIVSRAAYRGLP